MSAWAPRPSEEKGGIPDVQEEGYQLVTNLECTKLRKKESSAKGKEVKFRHA
jgi:hypothetical protein